MGRPEVGLFLCWLTSKRKVSASTHGQALSASLFLYGKVLGVDLPWMSGIDRPRGTKRFPVVLWPDEIARIFAVMEGEHRLTLQTVPPRLQGPEGDPNGAVRAGGFSLHAGVDVAPHEREKLERLCRYVSRPPVAVDRMALTASGQVRYTLKTPYRDGTTHIVLEPLDLMARLAALVPPLRMHLTIYHGVSAPHSTVPHGP